MSERLQQLGPADLATTQIYAHGLSERRRATVMALEFGGDCGTSGLQRQSDPVTARIRHL